MLQRCFEGKSTFQFISLNLQNMRNIQLCYETTKFKCCFVVHISHIELPQLMYHIVYHYITIRKKSKKSTNNYR
jgi:hypothetical protein